MDGLINLLKPQGITSNKAILKARKVLGQKKIGHSGTLDPGASGVLVLGVNQGTRVLKYLLNADKSYRVELTFGIKTDTADSFGKVIAKKDIKHLSEQALVDVLAKFKGTIDQIPPMTSAIKVNGKTLYKLARQGITIPREPRTITIKNISLLSFLKTSNNARVLFDVKCTKGTYVRTLCEDIAEELNSVGYMSYLLRTKTGPFCVTQALSITELEERMIEGKFDFLIPLDYLINAQGFVKYTVSQNELERVLNGASIKANIEDTIKEVALYTPSNKFIALGTVNNKIINIHKVFKRGYKC